MSNNIDSYIVMSRWSINHFPATIISDSTVVMFLVPAVAF